MPINNEKLETEVKEQRNNIRSDRLDMSFGEIMNLYEDKELIIQPEYQRAYRWDNIKKTGYIESILLGINTPPIFVAEDKDGRWELVDGLQRLSTILSFFGSLEDKKNNKFALEEGDIIKNLKGINQSNMPIRLTNTIKRATCRVEILRWDSGFDMRYELFKRLNTAVEPLTDQEVRNCIFRGNDKKLNGLLKELSQNTLFKDISNISEKDIEKMLGEELILRIFCFQYNDKITISLHKHLTSFMKNVTEGKIDFDYVKSKNKFLELLPKLKREFFRTKKNKYFFSARLWDAIWYPLFKTDNYKSFDIEKFVKLVKDEIEDAESTQSQERSRKAIKIGIKAYRKLIDENPTIKKNS